MGADERADAVRLAFLMTGNAEQAAAVAARALARAGAAGGPRWRRRLLRALVREVLGPWWRRVFAREGPAWPAVSGEPGGVWTAVLRLSPLGRCVLVLAAVEGLPVAGVAGVLGTRPEAAARLLASALAAAGTDLTGARRALAEAAAAVEVPADLASLVAAAAAGGGRWSLPRRLVLGAATLAAVGLIASGVASLRESGDEAATPTTARVRATPAPQTRPARAATTTTTRAGPWRVPAGSPVAGRTGASAVWTGRAFVVWGGDGAADGAVYEPAAGAWRDVAAAPVVPEGATATWTGRHVVLVGAPGRAVALDPESGAWSVLPDPPADIPARPAVVWTGSLVVVWGGPGLSFDPATGSWRRLPASGLDPRSAPVGAWTGDRMLVWGGEGFADGAAYDPVGRRWDRLPPAPLGSGTGAVGAWNGRELVVATPGGAAAYDPSTDRWRLLPAVPFAPVGLAALRGDVVAVGAGGEAAVLVRAPAGEVWAPLPPAPGPFGDRPAVAAGEVVLVAGRTVALLDPSAAATGEAR